MTTHRFKSRVVIKNIASSQKSILLEEYVYWELKISENFQQIVQTRRFLGESLVGKGVVRYVQ